MEVGRIPFAPCGRRENALPQYLYTSRPPYNHHPPSYVTVIFNPFFVIFSRRLEIQLFEKYKLGPQASLEDDKRYTSIPLYIHNYSSSGLWLPSPEGAKGKCHTSIPLYIHNYPPPKIKIYKNCCNSRNRT